MFLWDKIIYWSLLSVVFFTPIVFDPYCYDSFELPKITFVRIMSAIILFALYFKIIQSKREKINYLYIPVLFFITILVITTFNTSDVISSLKGTHKRQEGFFTILNYIFLFYVAGKFIEKEKIKDFIFVHILSATLISIYAILQHFGFDFFQQRDFDRSFSTLSHPNFLGAYLIMVIPFVLHYILNSKRWELKIASLFVSITIFVALLFTYSRASWIGFVISVILFFLIYGKDVIYQNKKIIFTSAIIFLSIIITVSYHTQKRESFTVTKRFLSIFDVKEDRSIGARFNVWKSGMKIIRDKPFLGWGIDNFKSIFPLYKLPDYVKYEGVRITADKAHNEIIHTTANQGFIGLFAYLWIVMMFYYKVFLNIKKDKILIAILCSQTAYLVQNQFSFSVITIGILFWIFLGFGINLTTQTQQKSNQIKKLKEKKTKQEEEKKINWTKYPLPSAICLLIITISIRLYIAERYFLSGYLAIINQDIDYGIERYKKAIELNPYEEFYFIKIAEGYEEKAKEDAKYLKTAKKYFIKATNISPLNAYNYSKLTKANAILARTTGDDKFYDEAEKNIKQALRLDPHNPVFLNNLGALYNDRKMPQEAIPYFKKSLYFSPDYNFALKNIAKSYILLKEYKEAIPYLEKVLQIDTSDDIPYKNLILCYMETGQKEKAKKIAKKLLQVKPDDEMTKNFLEEAK